VFIDDEDRRAFIAQARQASQEQRVAVHAYALGSSQVRLLATPTSDEGLARWMQSLGRRYGAGFNLRHGRRGALWDGRFRSCVMEPASWLRDATTWVESLPVQAGICAAASDWPWSSATHHVGRQRDAWIAEHAAYWSLGNTPFDRELAHARMLEAGMSALRASTLEAALLRGRVLGSAAYIAAVEARADRPLIARARGRPKTVPI
jgi:putative transposase